MNETVENLTYTIFVGKKVSDGAYGSDEVGIHVQVDVPAGTDPASEEAQLAVRNAANAAKAQVGVALGIETRVNNEGTLVYAAAPAAAAPAAAPASSPAAAVAAEFGATLPEPPFINPARGSAEEKANTAWVKERFATNPEEFWDNRESNAADPAKAKWPNVKHKTLGRKAGWDNDLVGWV